MIDDQASLLDAPSASNEAPDAVGAAVAIGEYDPVVYVHHVVSGASYVHRVCEGCGVGLRFAAQPGYKRLISCAACGRRTFWRVVQMEGVA